MAGDLANFTAGDIANCVGGHRMPGSSGKTYGVADPVGNSEYIRVSTSKGADVNRAVNMAEAALDGPWPALAAADRASVLHAIADGIAARAGDIADEEARNTGIPVTQARVLIDQAVSCFRSVAQTLTEPRPEPASAPGPGSDATAAGPPAADAGVAGPARAAGATGYVLRSPAGIAGLLGSWNAPFLSVARQLAPALAAGCMVIVKTHEWTPVSASVLPEIMAEAGVPAGAFSLLHGRRAEDAVPTLLAHTQVPLISFSGETSAVRETIQAAAAHLKRVSAESAGATPCVIFGDADLDRAADSAAFGAFALNGTAPGAGSRILVESSVYDDVVARLAARAAELRVGPPSDPETEIGPVTHADLYDRLVKQVRLGVREEARLAAGGSRPAGLTEGNFLAPTVFADVTPSMRIFTEEIAGPIAYVTSFSSQDEAVAAANALSGSSASVWTADTKRAEKVAGALKASATWVNSAVADTPAPGIDFFIQSRTVHVAPDDAPVPGFG